MTTDEITHDDLVDQAETVLEATSASLYYPVAHGEAQRLQNMIDECLEEQEWTAGRECADVTYVYIDPDWAMLFVDDECVRRGHSIRPYEAIRAVKDVEIESLNRYSFARDDDVDCVEYLDQLPMYLNEHGPGVLEDEQ